MRMTKKKNYRNAAVAILILVILMGAAITYSIMKKVSEAGVRTDLIVLSIDGNFANISVEMEIEPEIDSKDLELRMETDVDNVPLTYDGNGIRGMLTEKEFTSIIEKDEVNLTGNIDVPVFGPLKINRELKEKINISFIHELSSSMEVENVNVEFAIFYTVITFDIVANVSRDFQINITNTDALVTSPAGEFSAEVIELNYRTGNTGNARIRIPLIGALGLALNSRNVKIESWGISVTVNMPMFNG